MYAEAYKSPNNEIIMVVRGTEIKSIKDWSADYKLYKSKIPKQTESAYKFYNDLTNKYGNVVVTGYSLGASIGSIIGNETGAETITYACYGVGDIVEPRYTDNIINFGNEADPVFQKNIDNQLGKIYVIPNSDNYEVNGEYGAETSNKPGDIKRHFPGKNGAILLRLLNTQADHTNCI